MMSRRHVLGSAVLAAGSAAVTATAMSNPEPVRNSFAFEARVAVAAPLVLGPTTVGLRRVIPITGGTRRRS